MQPQTTWLGGKLTPLVKGLLIHLEAKGCSPRTPSDGLPAGEEDLVPESLSE